MAYASLQDLIARYGMQMLVDLTDRAETPSGVIDSDVADRARLDAEALIDGFVAAKYSLPLSEVPALITDLTLKIWIYNLHVHASGEKIKADFDQAIRTLRDISAGSVRLPGAAGSEPATAISSGAEFTDRDRAFTPETLRGFI